MTDPVLLVAASGLAREVASAWSGGTVLGFLDDDPAKAGAELAGLPVLGPLEAVADHPAARLVVCAGKGAARRTIVARLAALGVGDDRFATVVDPGVRVPTGCTVGAGSILLAGTVLTAQVRVGRHVVCMPHVTLTHDDVVEDFATLAAGVTLGGGVRIGEAAYLGMNSSVRENCSVGHDAVLGMGATLVRDQPDGSVWAGTPATELKKESE
jgi:sugar O-acyltransferase (sialic acid O-acetyltransferase NeuD family)